MIPLPTGIKIWLVAGYRYEKRLQRAGCKVTALKDEPMSGHVFIFRRRQSG
ncbi:Putative transposase (identified by ISEscan HMM) [Klebsiella pneumoniae]|nr:Putative transposase (identified by ISEscan HMM) [Klebsiella pneumoniae]